jgi:hypothetical protein
VTLYAWGIAFWGIAIAYLLLRENFPELKYPRGSLGHIKLRTIISVPVVVLSFVFMYVMYDIGGILAGALFAGLGCLMIVDMGREIILTNRRQTVSSVT